MKETDDENIAYADTTRENEKETAMAKSTAMRRQPKQARGEERIATILQAAAQVFHEVGFDAATTNMIAQRAHTAIGSLYDFFPNKETIATRLSEQFCAEIGALFENVLTDELVHMPLTQLIDRILDPLVQYHQTHPGMLALWLKSQDDPRLSAMGQDLNETLAQKTARIFTRRYPQCDEASALRYSRICMQTVQALTVLAFKGSQVDLTVIAELKTMIRAYLREVLEPEEDHSGNESDR
jgi:AcrR family transcriptional regulator